MKVGNGSKFQSETSLTENERIRSLEKETLELKMKNKALNIDKKILMKMMKNIFGKMPEAMDLIDQEKFMKTLEDV